MPRALIHTMLRILDEERSLAFYGKLGFEETSRKRVGGDTATVIFLALPGDGERLELTLNDGRSLQATKVGSDEATDIAVLKLACTEKLTAVPLGAVFFAQTSGVVGKGLRFAGHGIVPCCPARVATGRSPR